MRLALSSAAAPGASPAELAAACRRRGLDGIEIALTNSAGNDAVAVPDLGSGRGQPAPDLVGIYRSDLPREAVAAAARLSAALNAPTVVPLDSFDRCILPLAAESFARAGARLLFAHRGDPRVAEAIRNMVAPIPGQEVLGLAWEIRPGADDVETMAAVLDAAGDRLAYVRMYGGGPESQAQTGLGIGTVMARLALGRYAGPLVLTPSTPRYHYAWSAWLGRAGGWGCGSKQSDDSLVTLARAPAPVGES